MVRVKICGIMNKEDAVVAVEAGADALGFILYERSPRYAAPERVAEIVAVLPPFVTSIGVFVDAPADRVNQIAAACRLDAVQLHGDETPEYCDRIDRTVVKAFRVKDGSWCETAARYQVRAVLLDACAPDRYGGTGSTFDWDFALNSPHPVVLSGGLNPDNVAEAIRHVGPLAVDVSSGVEHAPGVKDHDKVQAFIKRAKDAG
ncbi:MAG: phosphoribosylanthranilate isomerase [candidate division Zixibacteria bacterium]|nr:phosphoribosylanthranilate isomerase [candidate division Zixibacteria bacterium]